MEIKIITIRLPVALVQAIDALADATHQAGALRGPSTRSDVIRDALITHVQTQPMPRVQTQPTPTAKRVIVRSMSR